MTISEADRRWIDQAARELADQMADLLQQEYKMVGPEWWLWTLGKPKRPLSEREIEYARGRGLIP